MDHDCPWKIFLSKAEIFLWQDPIFPWYESLGEPRKIGSSYEKISGDLRFFALWTIKAAKIVLFPAENIARKMIRRKLGQPGKGITHSLTKHFKKRLLKTSEMLLVWLAGPSLYTSSTSSKMKWLQRISQVFSQKTPLLTRILAGFIRKAKTFTNSWCFCSEIFKEAENSDKQIRIEKLIMVICCIATTCLQLNFWILSK